MRELTQIEYTKLFGFVHRDPKRFAELLTAINKVAPESRRILFSTGHRGRLPVTQVYRDTLPQIYQDILIEHELTLDVPYVGGQYGQ